MKKKVLSFGKGSLCISFDKDEREFFSLNPGYFVSMKIDKVYDKKRKIVYDLNKEEKSSLEN